MSSKKAGIYGIFYSKLSKLVLRFGSYKLTVFWSPLVCGVVTDTFIWYHINKHANVVIPYKPPEPETAKIEG